MTANPDVFRTFCHISEYGEWGYANLHRMVAASSPLVLWAPSSMLLATETCRVSGKDFLALLDEGKIRIVARERWLFDRAYRDQVVPWEGARWVPAVDDRVLVLANEDAGRPVNERRVLVAAPERGKTWAAGHVEENPELVRDIMGALRAPDAEQHFPVGVVETARRGTGTDKDLTTRIVRDAYNHDAAIVDAGTRTPFALNRRESRFARLLESVRTASDIRFEVDPPGLKTSATQADLAELTGEVLEILRALERERSVGVTRFVRSDGHASLARWVGELCDSAAHRDGRVVGTDVLTHLQRDFDGGTLADSWKDVFVTSESIIGNVGTVTGIVDVATAGTGILGAIGLAAGGYSVGRSFAKRWGYAAVEYDGPQWVFLYAFGRKASRRRERVLEDVLSRLVPS